MAKGQEIGSLKVMLRVDTYDRLAAMAEAEERSPMQQAAWIIRQVVERWDPGRGVQMATYPGNDPTQGGE